MSKLLEKLKNTVYWDKYRKKIFLTKLEKDTWEGKGLEIFNRCQEIIRHFEGKQDEEISDQELYQIGQGFFQELFQMNDQWYASKLDFRDVAHHHNFQCPYCQEKHQLETWYNQTGTILYLNRDYEWSNCQFLDKYNEGIIYDYSQKEIAEVINDTVDREIAQQIKKQQAVASKREKRRVIIQKRMKEKGLKTIGIGDNLEQLGIELLTEFTCDICENLFTEADIQTKNYQLNYSRVHVNYFVEYGGCQAENWLHEAKHQKC